MHRPSAQHETQDIPSTRPFDPLAARRLRAGLGMGVEHVAYGMRSSYGLPYVTPDLVLGWEGGVVAPTGPELAALAGVLWCSAGELLGEPRTLREHRLARSLAPEDVARRTGLDPVAYRRMEESGRWRGTERQTTALAELFDLSPRGLVTVTGREEKLAELLRGAVASRRPVSARPLAKLVPLDRGLLERVLQELHATYRTAAADQGAARDFLDHIAERFWAAADPGTQGS
ncbi:MULTISPECIES: helix-turn-helix domain-containing protein [Streptomyces]|uniref:helix-turn-helix domain-containing protein n=1 Tax=Streptomyces TaxID=1883 RepID=UPI0027E47BBC|nr:helix-turn-helix transcriptional regulator [Streptomyces ruber]